MHTNVEVSRSALEHNIRAVRGLLAGGVNLAAVVKSNAYGHGLADVAKVVSSQADLLAVASCSEALALRAQGIASRILVLSVPEREHLEACIQAGVELPLFSLFWAKCIHDAAKQVGTPAQVHLKIDTGASRVGVLPDDVAAFLRSVADDAFLSVVGAFSHFSDSEDPECAYTSEQIDRFRAALPADAPFEKHMACSAAILLSPDAQFDMVRLGLSLYGLWPSEEVRRVVQQRHAGFALRPVLTWKTTVLQVKQVPSGTAIGYGCSYTTRRPTRLAVLPVGYWDGYPRHASNQADVLIRGSRCAVLGRVCMNLMMVDVTDVSQPVQEGDEVVLLGTQGTETISADELAQHAQTINYEVVTRINCLLPRLLVA